MMRIGRFCKQFNIPLTTVRYYILSGLLAPNKRNTQYVFTDSDINEMKTIIQLKELNFSNEEIKQFLQITRLYHSDDKNINSCIISFFNDKKKRLEKELEKIKNSITILNQKIDEYDRNHEYIQIPHGVPISFCSYLACPRCENTLKLSQVRIQDNQIYQGVIDCSCGYKAQIEEGIILTETNDFNVKDGSIPSPDFYTSPAFYVMHYREKPQPDADFVFFQYMHDISSEVTALIYKAYSWINSIIAHQSMIRPLIFAPDLSSHYLYKNLSNPFFKDSLLIVSGFSKQTIASIKSHIDQVASDLQIIYIANTIYDLPIRKKCIDLWIDANSSYNFSFFHNHSLQEKINPYMGDKSSVIGYTKYYSSGSRSLKNIQVLYPYALPNNSLFSTFVNNMNSANWKLEKQEEFGYVLEPGSYYEYHQENEHHNFLGFYAVK